ncbi:hypothetical protein B9Z55_007510 [Caenorhabditis nigoni]|uniref:Uncharacterized protein n=1 Tax=Caenorhabditis nigoni TaxID=1611254 RepID=A0A2G5V9Y2_9PELO|nr:hypothetical protein B9Z55_007510 [Caenorhabditis nigoni]
MQFSEPSSVLPLLTPPMIPTATTSPYGKMNQDELQASQQTCSFQIQIFSAKLKLWSENALRKDMTNSLEDNIQILNTRLMWSEKLNEVAQRIVERERNLKGKEEEHSNKRKEAKRMRLEQLASCSTENEQEQRREYKGMAQLVTNAFFEEKKSKLELMKQKSIWNKTIKQFNDEGAELKEKKKDLRKSDKTWRIVNFLLKKIDEAPGDNDQYLLDLIEKLIKGPDGFELTIDDQDIISNLNIEESMFLLDAELPEFSWENRERLWSVIEKEKLVLDVLKANLDMIKIDEFHNEMCKEIGESVEILKEKLPLITKLQASATSVQEAEKMVLEKEAELQNYQRSDQYHKDLAQAQYEKGDFISHLATLKKQVEAATKVEEIDRVVKEREKDLCKKKEIKDEEIKKVDAIDKRLKNGQAKLKGLEKDWEAIKSMARSLENQNDNKIDRRRKSNLLAKRLQNQDPRKLDPDEQNLLSQFTRCNGDAHEGEPTAKRERLEVKDEQGTSKKRRIKESQKRAWIEEWNDESPEAKKPKIEEKSD